jgi:hypothetical protein
LLFGGDRRLGHADDRLFLLVAGDEGDNEQDGQA